MSDSSEETASLDFLSEDEDDEEEFWEQDTMASSGDGASSCDCNIDDRYTKDHTVRCKENLLQQLHFKIHVTFYLSFYICFL